MNVRGERILIFGDSLTAHSSATPAVWEVNAGSSRVSSVPGDLLGSLLMEQGAAAVRTDGRVSRSARNFWEREAAQPILSADVAWRPTQVVIMLGTNDVGMDPAKTRQGMIALRDVFKAAGADVWAIGPFHSSKPPAGVAAVVEIMRSVFGVRFIDGRPLSELAQHSSDGLHYTSAGARTLALALADGLISKPTPAKIFGTAALGLLGAIAAVGVGVLWMRRERPLLDGAAPTGIEVVNGRRFMGSANELVRQGFTPIPCKGGYDEKGIARCWGQPIDAASEEVDEGDDDDAVMIKRIPVDAKLDGPAEDAEDEAEEDKDWLADDWMERLNARTARRHKPLIDALEAHPAVIVDAAGGRKLLLIRSAEMSNPERGAVRVTVFDEDGPMMHVTKAAIAPIATELSQDWRPQTITPADDEAVMAFTSTERFAAGAAAVARMQRVNAGLER